MLAAEGLHPSSKGRVILERLIRQLRDRNSGLNLESTANRVGGADTAAMQPRDTLRDRQTQANAARLPVASISNAVKGTKDICQLTLRNARTMIANRKHG